MGSGGIKHRLDWTGEVVCFAGYLAACLAAGELLYQSFQVGLIFLPVYPFLSRGRKKQKRIEEQTEWAVQFKDALISIKASLEAGYSMENAVLAAREDLVCIYPKDSFICREMERIGRGITNAVPVEEAFQNFAERSGLEDAQSFAEIYRTAKKSGGDLLRVLQSSVTVITDKTELKREIQTILTAKKMECRIMKLIPPGMLLYFRLFSPGYLDVLYDGAGGHLLMTALFAAYLFLMWLMGQITGIEI
ncbi:MAG: type II secretion system F family protein [Lachnospiraceae bacterium]|nr:type II secretion system F family protein [Lachnospiraceae bacterium]